MLLGRNNPRQTMMSLTTINLFIDPSRDKLVTRGRFRGRMDVRQTDAGKDGCSDGIRQPEGRWRGLCKRASSRKTYRVREGG